MSPLEEVAVLVIKERMRRGSAVDILNNNIATIKGGGDLNAHGTLIVVPDSPGKSLNRASANLLAARPGWAAGEPAFASTWERPSQIACPSDRRKFERKALSQLYPSVFPPD